MAWAKKYMEKIQISIPFHLHMKYQSLQRPRDTVLNSAFLKPPQNPQLWVPSPSWEQIRSTFVKNLSTTFLLMKFLKCQVTGSCKGSSPCVLLEHAETAWDFNCWVESCAEPRRHLLLDGSGHWKQHGDTGTQLAQSLSH